MKGRVTEKERVAGTNGGRSGGRGWYVQWQGKKSRERTNSLREIVRQQTDFFNLILSLSHTLSLISHYNVCDDIKPELKQEGTFISLLSPNRPSPSLFEKSFTPTHIKDSLYLFFWKQGEKERLREWSLRV